MAIQVDPKGFHAADGHRHRLVGFDARQNWLPMANWWPQNGPYLYLLRDDVVRPCSVDKNIWSPVCSAVADLKRPDDAGPFPPLWSDHGRLVGHLATKPGMDARRYSLIAVTLALDTLDAGAMEWLPLLGPDAPDLGGLDSTWTLLGYDVANPKFLSGLTDTPYDTGQEDIAGLRARWEPHLSDRHLFTALDQARAFIAICEERARRFGPFGAYGIWERR